MGCDGNKTTEVTWSKSYMVSPSNNFKSHARINQPQFVASYEYDENPPPMNLLLGMEYARIWQRERDVFAKSQYKTEKRKIIRNNFQDWVEKRKPRKKTEKCDLYVKIKKSPKHGKGKESEKPTKNPAKAVECKKCTCHDNQKSNKEYNVCACFDTREKPVKDVATCSQAKCGDANLCGQPKKNKECCQCNANG